MSVELKDKSETKDRSKVTERATKLRSKVGSWRVELSRMNGSGTAAEFTTGGIPKPLTAFPADSSSGYSLLRRKILHPSSGPLSPVPQDPLSMTNPSARMAHDSGYEPWTCHDRTVTEHLA